MATDRSKLYTVISLTVITMFATIIAVAAITARKDKQDDPNKITDGSCHDAIKIIIVSAFNEDYTCNNADQNVEIYPAGSNGTGNPTVLVKCVCRRSEKP